MAARSSKSTKNLPAFACDHNHDTCIAEALENARVVCEQSGERFTDLRMQVFELVWAGHKPVKAYDLLSALSAKRSGVAPATVYRTLDFLQTQGLVHKLESLNAYLGCSQPKQDHQGQFLICEGCEEVRELESKAFSNSVSEVESKQAFQVKHMTVELFGLCSKCQQTAAGAT